MKYQKKIVLIIFLIAVPFTLIPRSIIANEIVARITIKAGDHAHHNTPVSMPLDRLPDSILKTSLRLERLVGSQRIPIPSQIDPGNPATLWWLLPDTVKAAEELVYELVLGKPIIAPLVQLCLDDQALEISQHNRKVLRYQYALLPPPVGTNPLNIRSGFIHPIWSPAGKILTRIHPSDHLHHLGLWNPWTKTEFEGREVDFWNLREGQGTVRFVEFISLTTGSIFGGFEALQHHVDLSAPAGEKVALNEVWNVRAWSQTNPDQNYGIWDFTTTQRCATSSPLTILKYRYGGFGFRATADWNVKNSDCLTSEGKTRADGNGTRARWCNVFGVTDKGPAGVLLLSHTANHENPEPMRIWPTESQDMFLGFCPVVYSEWKMEPGIEYVRKYRMIVYDGAITAEDAEQFWQDFVQPPNVKVEWLSHSKK